MTGTTGLNAVTVQNCDISATIRAINLAQLLTLVVFLNLVGCGNETKGHELKVMESTSEDFSKLESRHPWGDLGMDLMNGVILDDTNGKLQLGAARHLFKIS